MAEKNGANLFSQKKSLETVTSHHPVLPLQFNSLIYSSLTHSQLQSSQSNQQAYCSGRGSNWLLELNGGLSDCQNDSLKEIYYYNFSKSINVTVSSTKGIHFPVSVLGIRTCCCDEGQATAVTIRFYFSHLPNFFPQMYTSCVSSSLLYSHMRKPQLKLGPQCAV